MSDRDLSGALRTVLNILDAWGISQRDRLVLLGCNQETYEGWICKRELTKPSSETLERLSLLLGIWKALVILYPEPEHARTWIQRPNEAAAFSGLSPLSVMTQERIDGLRQVRLFLDSWLD